MGVFEGYRDIEKYARVIGMKELTDAHKTDDGIEFWLARDLQQLLGYDKWDNFLGVISKTKIACETTGHKTSDHFADAGKMVKLGSGSEREIEDIMLTRYACYLVAQNGDPRKEAIAFAQNYFAVLTRKFEIIEKRIQDGERLIARQKLSETEKKLSGVIFEHTGSDKNFALIRSKGDKALFNYTTQEMKKRLGAPDGRALADFQPTILLKAKDFATEITIFNTKEKSLRTEQSIRLKGFYGPRLRATQKSSHLFLLSQVGEVSNSGA